MNKKGMNFPGLGSDGAVAHHNQGAGLVDALLRLQRVKMTLESRDNVSDGQKVLIDLLTEFTEVMKDKLSGNPLYEEVKHTPISVLHTDPDIYDKLLEASEIIYQDGNGICINSAIKLFNGDDVTNQADIFRNQMEKFSSQQHQIIPSFE